MHQIEQVPQQFRAVGHHADQQPQPEETSDHHEQPPLGALMGEPE
jgi:hypothetical protein